MGVEDEDEDNRFTRRAAKDAEDTVARALAERLASARQEWFVQVPLDDQLTLGERLAHARGMKPSGARRREVRFISKLLQGVDQRPIVAALDRAESGASADIEAEQAAEAWRERLIEEGDKALDVFCADHRDCDRQRLRQLARQAQRQREQGATPKASRALFKLVRQALTKSL